MPAPPSRNDIAGTGGSAPSNATARTGFGAFWDYVTTLLGASGNASDARTALGLAIGTDVLAPNGDASGLVNLPNGGLKNRFINGAMTIDQRNAGAAQTFTAAAALAYCVDQWYGYCTGANVTGQRVAGTAPNQYNYQFTGAASVTKIGFAQRIEAANSQDLAGQTATLSVDLANSLLATVTWTAWYANTADTFGTLASPTRTQIATGTFTVTSTLTRYSAQISIPSAATTGIEVEFSVGAQTSGTWTIGRAQLENGAVATSFEILQIGTIRHLCQAYFEWVPVNLAFSSTAATWLFSYTASFKATKRVVPTLGALVADPNLSQVSTNVNSAAVSNPSQEGCRVAVDSLVSGLVTYTGYRVSASCVL